MKEFEGRDPLFSEDSPGPNRARRRLFTLWLPLAATLGGIVGLYTLLRQPKAQVLPHLEAWSQAMADLPPLLRNREWGLDTSYWFNQLRQSVLDGKSPRELWRLYGEGARRAEVSTGMKAIETHLGRYETAYSALVRRPKGLRQLLQAKETASLFPNPDALEQVRAVKDPATALATLAGLNRQYARFFTPEVFLLLKQGIQRSVNEQATMRAIYAATIAADVVMTRYHLMQRRHHREGMAV